MQDRDQQQRMYRTEIRHEQHEGWRYLIAITKAVVCNKFYLQRFDYTMVILFRHTERMAYVSAIICCKLLSSSKI